MINIYYSGFPFIYGETPSEQYDLLIMSVNNTSWQHPSGSDIEIVTDKVWNNPSDLFLGAKHSPNLEFPMEIVSSHELDVYEVDSIKQWLYNTSGFKKLRICGNGLEDYYFNCKLKPKDDYIINGYNGFSFQVICDSPWAFTKPQIHKFDLLTEEKQIIRVNNFSSDSNNVIPYIEFTTITNSKYFCITNKSNNDYKYEWIGLENNETIKCDWTRQVKSSIGLRRSKCLTKDKNHGFFELVYGVNILEITPCKNLIIKYDNVKRLGGG